MEENINAVTYDEAGNLLPYKDDDLDQDHSGFNIIDYGYIATQNTKVYHLVSVIHCTPISS